MHRSRRRRRDALVRDAGVGGRRQAGGHHRGAQAQFDGADREGRVDRQGRRPVRLLPVGADHVGDGTPREEPAPERRGYGRGNEGKHLPLRHVSTGAGGDQERFGCARQGQEGVDMNLQSHGRRHFLQSSAALAGGLVIGFWLPADRGRPAFAEDAPKPPIHPNAFLRIGKDGTCTVMVKHLEFGQGVMTSLPMIVAEELDCDWSKVRAELAPAAPEYAHTLFGMQITGGSSSVVNSFDQLRTVGAQARAMLVQAAAGGWKVKPAECRTEKGFVLGPGGKRAAYGQLAEAAGKLPVPEKVALKASKDFKIIGKPTRRLDAADKVEGRAVFGLDVKLPSAGKPATGPASGTPPRLHVAVVAHPPAFGARLKSFSPEKVKAIPGVTHVIQLEK